MTTKTAQVQLKSSVLEALLRLGPGEWTTLELSKALYKELIDSGLKKSDDLFYTWGYDFRWVLHNLKESGILVKGKRGNHTTWTLNYRRDDG